jgi:hypothetical protein
MISLPKIDACCADADLFGNLSNCKTALDSCVVQIAGEVSLTRQWRSPICSQRTWQHNRRISRWQDNLSVIVRAFAQEKSSKEDADSPRSRGSLQLLLTHPLRIRARADLALCQGRGEHHDFTKDGVVRDEITFNLQG